MKWPQPPTPVQVDNYTATGIYNRKIKQKMPKAFDMIFYWICDRIDQKNSMYIGKRGTYRNKIITTKTTLPPITGQQDQHTQISHKYNIVVIYKGVLIRI